MKRQYFLLIVIAGGIIGVLTLLFFIFSNPYERLNPPEPQVPAQIAQELPPIADQAVDTELISALTKETIGVTTGIDGLRLVFYDKSDSKIKVSEYDGTGEQELSDTLLGVEAMGVAPTKEKAWLRLTDPETSEAITLVYDFRVKEAVRLENGIQTIDWSPDGLELVYFVERQGAAPALKIVEANGIEPRTVRDNFSVQDPVIDWYGQDALAYWLAPSSTRPSSTISLTTRGANAVQLAPEGIAQQVKFSPDGQFALIGQNNPDSGKPQLLLGVTAERDLQVLPLTTWLDKCTWLDDSARILCFVPRNLPGGFTYPEDDDGSLDYGDQLWVIDAATAKPQLIYDVPQTIKDARDPFASQNGSRLNFLIRPDGVLASLDLTDKLVAPTIPSENTNQTNTANTANTANSPGGSTD
ncbi:MAG: hypothetical protein V1895_00705 [Parcubacteria group bacterium]